MISKERLEVVTMISNNLSNTRAGEDLVTIGRNKFVETGDVGGKSFDTLLKYGLIFKIEHVGEFNSPDYGITHLGYQVYEHIQMNKK